MHVTSSRITLTKRYPLTISWGTFAESTNVIVRVEHDGVAGLGEMAPADLRGDAADRTEAAVAVWNDALAGCSPFDRQRVDAVLSQDEPFEAPARAALDMALYDWLGHRAGLPVWRMLGGDRSRIVPTSLTIGMNPPSVVTERVPEILERTGAKVLKVKLGSPDGTEADRAMFAAAQDAAASSGWRGTWRVDANGGWDVDDARTMARWLADRDVEMLEQPLARGREDDLAALHRDCPLPLVADESVRVAADVPALADRVDGVNLKLMKCGGIDEALRIIHTARSHRLSVMIGCMGESSLAISAGAQLAPFVDHLDLDSHLNLLDDPFDGATFVDGVVTPNDRPGLGVVERGRP